jgi:peptidoglycan DL-endopeptidase CwlO
VKGLPAAALAVVAAGGLVLGLAILGGAGGATSGTVTGSQAAVAAAFELAEQDGQCQSLGPVPGLSAAQAADAETIVSVSDTLSHESAQSAQIALMTSLTESDLVNIDGGEGGAYGLFQQTPPSWGTVAQIMDPTYAATQFVAHLLQVSSWATIQPWVAAQEVQRSGAGEPNSPENPDPGVTGGNYQVNWAQAGAVLALVRGKATTTGCGGGPTGGEPGPPSSHGLPVGYSVPAGTTPQATAAINYAISKLGDGYVWGAAGPNTFDCSGLTMMAWAAGGVRLDHYTVDQMHEGQQVPASQIAPGDLVLIPGSDPPGPGLPGHVGIYLGDSLVLSAVDPQYGVIVQSWATFTGGGLDAIVNPLNPGS